MSARANYKLMMLAALVLVLGELPVSVVQSQQRRRPSRRVTHPVRTRPVTQPQPMPVPAGADPTLISTAEEQQGAVEAQAQAQAAKRAARQAANTDQESARKLDQLSQEFTRLNQKFDVLEKQRQGDLLQERLTRAEQRAEGLRAQLSQTMEKQADLQARLEQLDYDLRPESVQLRAATIPSMNGDAVRSQITQQLENEKKRVRAQLDVVEATRTHLETSIVGADAEAERLRARLNELMDNNAGTSNATASPSPTPSSSPPPPAQ
jgi:chromosome segregation ATPase